MTTIHLIAVGKFRRDPYQDLFAEYEKRMSPWRINLTEIKAHDTAEEREKISKLLNPEIPLFVCDERGKQLSSSVFASQIGDYQRNSIKDLQFVIGGADGVGGDIRKKARHLIAFGKQTWPHMMVRVMLIEQIYRAKQILSGHPYHRDS